MKYFIIWYLIGLITMVIWRIALVKRDPKIWKEVMWIEIFYMVSVSILGPIVIYACIKTFKQPLK